MSENPPANMDTLLNTMARLRAEDDGCDWCGEQTFSSIAPYTIEEAFEVVDAIAGGNRTALCEELGDMLLHVIFHARMAEEEGSFAFADVVAAIQHKLMRRHPQVFAQAESSHSMQVDWEAIKRREREQKGEARSSLMDGVPAGIPALLQAEKLQRKAALVGFDWSNIQEVLAKLDEEVAELKEALSGPESSRNRQAAQDELGDVLFTLVNLARHLDGGHAQSSAEQALRRASHKFSRRFRFMEAVRNGEMDGLSASEWERLWQQAKRNPETTKTS